MSNTNQRNNTNSTNNTKSQTTDNSMMIMETELNAANIFNKKSAFDLAVRMADGFSKSTIVPKDYQGNPANCLIALEMANRIGTSPMMVMQNLNIIQGRPAWSSQFIIAMINNSKKFKTSLQYEIKGRGMEMECFAFTFDQSGRRIEGPKITMKMAEQEGWLGKNGSKWKTMPEVMIRYRAASFFGRLHCPDLIMGIYSADEVIDIPESDYRYVDPIPTETNADTVDDDSHAAITETERENENTDKTASEDEYEDIDFSKTISTTTEGTKDVEANEESDTGEKERLSCSGCGANITQTEHNFSTKKYGRELCMNCQKEVAKG